MSASGLYRLARVANLILWPFLIFLLLVVLLLVPRARPHIGERLGLGGGNVRKGRKTVLFHLASLGEANAAMPLIRHLAETGHSLLLTTTSESGRNALVNAFPHLPVSLLPLDLPGIWEPFWTHRSIDRIILFETEIWPMMLLSAMSRKIPVLVASGRLSPKGFESMSRWMWVLRPVFKGLTTVLAASPADATRYRDMGVREESLAVCGNIKWDLSLPTASPEWTNLVGSLSGWLSGFEQQSLENGPFPDGSEDLPPKPFIRVVWGSAHPEEVHRVLERVITHPEGFARIHWMIAPRHLNRLPLLLEGPLSSEACRVQFRSGRRDERPEDSKTKSLAPGIPPGSGPLVSILDTHGELRALYALSDIALTGGTFDPVGGHSPVEAAAQGVPQIAGPHVEHVSALIETLREGGGLFQVVDEEDLLSRLSWLISHPEDRKKAGSLAREIVEGEQGALARTIARVEDFLKSENHDRSDIRTGTNA